MASMDHMSSFSIPQHLQVGWYIDGLNLYLSVWNKCVPVSILHSVMPTSKSKHLQNQLPQLLTLIYFKPLNMLFLFVPCYVIHSKFFLMLYNLYADFTELTSINHQSINDWKKSSKRFVAVTSYLPYIRSIFSLYLYSPALRFSDCQVNIICRLPRLVGDYIKIRKFDSTFQKQFYLKFHLVENLSGHHYVPKVNL